MPRSHRARTHPGRQGAQETSDAIRQAHRHSVVGVRRVRARGRQRRRNARRCCREIPCGDGRPGLLRRRGLARPQPGGLTDCPPQEVDGVRGATGTPAGPAANWRRSATPAQHERGRDERQPVVRLRRRTPSCRRTDAADASRPRKRPGRDESGSLAADDGHDGVGLRAEGHVDPVQVHRPRCALRARRRALPRERPRLSKSSAGRFMRAARAASAVDAHHASRQHPLAPRHGTPSPTNLNATRFPRPSRGVVLYDPRQIAAGPPVAGDDLSRPFPGRARNDSHAVECASWSEDGGGVS